MVHKSVWPTLRIAPILGQHKERHRGFTRLAAAIKEASGGLNVDRRKLRKIVNGDETVPLTVKDFVAIDAYLAPFGDGLTDKPLFDSPWILNGLVDHGPVLMLLGSLPEENDRRANVSRWDLKAVAKVTRQIHGVGPATGIMVDDVEFTDKPPSRDVGESLPVLNDRSTSLCIIGSQRACWAAEVALADMFGVASFSDPDPRLPFHFVWSANLKNFYRQSTFALDASALSGAHRDAADALRSDDTRALVVGDKPYLSRRPEQNTTWKDYGVVVAQRREGGHVVTVLAGLSGPGTFAAAEALVSHRTGTLPRAPEGGGHGKVRWALVEATVEDRGGKRDNRAVIATRVIDTFLYPEM